MAPRWQQLHARMPRTEDDGLNCRQRRAYADDGHPHKYVVRPASAGTQTESYPTGVRCKSTWAKQSCQGYHKHTRARHNTKSAYNQVARQLTGRIKVQEPVTYQDPREHSLYLGWC
jgi:hypothetical protein